MSKMFHTSIVTAALLAGAVIAGSEEHAAILPTGLGEEVDRAVEQVREATTAFRSRPRWPPATGRRPNASNTHPMEPWVTTSPGRSCATGSSK